MLICPECEAICENQPLPKGAELHCGRCGVRVKRNTTLRSLQPAWALSTLGLIFVIWANVEPILTFSVAGNEQTNYIITGVGGLFSQGYGSIAALVFFSAIAAPVLHLASIWYVSAACCLRRRWPGLERMQHFAERLEPWNLVPVFAIACVVSVVKLDMLGDVYWQIGSLWILALSLCTLFTVQFFAPDLVEEALKELA